MDKNISFTLKVWRQKGPKVKGAFETYQMKERYSGRYFIPRNAGYPERTADF